MLQITVEICIRLKFFNRTTEIMFFQKLLISMACSDIFGLANLIP